jgi:hypothetical protein
VARPPRHRLLTAVATGRWRDLGKTVYSRGEIGDRYLVESGRICRIGVRGAGGGREEGIGPRTAPFVRRARP